MINFLKSIFSSETGQTDETEQTRKRNFDILKYDGIKAINMGKTGYAIRCFKEAILLEEDFETLSYLAKALTRQDETEEAITVYTRMLNVEPGHTDTLLARAGLFLAGNRIQEAIEDCKCVVSADPQEFRAYLVLAKARQELQENEEAILHLSQAIDIKEDLAPAYLLRATILAGIKKHREALDDVEKLLSVQPEEENGLLLRGKIHEALENTGKAIEDYRNVIELNPFNEQAYMELGRILIARNELDHAIHFFDEAIEFKPDFAQAYIERGRAKGLKGEHESALSDHRKGLELSGETGMEQQPVNFDKMYANRPL